MKPPETKKFIPDNPTLECLAKLPEDIKKMALAYAQGVYANHKIENSH